MIKMNTDSRLSEFGNECVQEHANNRSTGDKSWSDRFRYYGVMGISLFQLGAGLATIAAAALLLWHQDISYAWPLAYNLAFAVAAKWILDRVKSDWWWSE